jgi:hypothetical protein
MALLEESLTTAQAAKLLCVDVSRMRQRLRERSLFEIEYEGSWRLPRFPTPRGVGTRQRIAARLSYGLR